jgi:hypothetical protein
VCGCHFWVFWFLSWFLFALGLWTA